MKLRNKIFPYPVLEESGKNYINSFFKANIDVKKDFLDLLITCNFDLNDSKIEELIANGKAKYAVNIECSSTSFRKQYETDNKSLFQIRIPQNDLYKRIEICTFIITTEEIKEYTNKNFNEDYKDITVNMKKGNIIAYSQQKEVEIEFQKTSLDNFASVIKITCNDNSKDPCICVNTDKDDYIIIKIDKKYYNKYCLFGKGNYKNTMIAEMIFPAMVIVLSKISIDYEQYPEEFDGIYNNKKWFKVLKKKLDENKISIDKLNYSTDSYSILSIAQRIFGDPIAKSLEELYKLDKMDGEQQ